MKKLLAQSPEILLRESNLSLCIEWEAKRYFKKSLSEYKRQNKKKDNTIQNSNNIVLLQSDI